jgi:ABC-type amino acid transport substrate-binding protein
VNRRKALATGCFAMLLGVPRAPADGETPPHTLTQGVLQVGTYFINPPFEFVANGKRVGFEVDLIDEIAHRLHLRPVFVDTQWEVMLQQMQEDRYDCIVGGITITPERRQSLAWSNPYITTTLSLIVNPDKTPQIHDLAGLKDATVGVQAATTDYDVAVVMQQRGEIKAVKTYPFAQIADAITDLSAERITAVMKVAPVAAWLAQHSPGLRIVAQVPNDPQPLGIGFSKGNPDLLAAVNQALAAMTRDGSYARLARKWGVF